MTCTIAPPPTISGGRTTQPFAWQGWRLRVPFSWNPLVLEGDFSKGHALLADLDGPRLGLRWRTIKPGSVSEDTLRRVIREEAGDAAARRAKPMPDPDTDPDVPRDHLLHIDLEAPGRDVFVLYSASGRLVQLVYHARQRDDVLRGEILPTFTETALTRPRWWAVYDLSCAVPAAMVLSSRRLDAGDAALHFADFNTFVTVRQIALARMALARKPLSGWLAEQQRARRLRFRATDGPAELMLETDDGRMLNGMAGRMRRRRRFCWSWRTPRESVTLALHDAARDRVIIVEASDAALARDVARTVGQQP